MTTNNDSITVLDGRKHAHYSDKAVENSYKIITVYPYNMISSPSCAGSIQITSPTIKSPFNIEGLLVDDILRVSGRKAIREESVADNL